MSLSLLPMEISSTNQHPDPLAIRMRKRQELLTVHRHIFLGRLVQLNLAPPKQIRQAKIHLRPCQMHA